jgi:hypothetical protein
MKKAAMILGVVVALGLMVTPASAAVDDPTTDATVDVSDEAKEVCDLQYPPQCSVGPVDCNFGHTPAADDCEAETGPVCDLQHPPNCEVGPVACSFDEVPGADDCDVTLATTGSPIPPPCFVDETVEAGETSVRVTVGHCQ